MGRQWGTRSFARFFLIIVAVELVLVATAWAFLNVGASRWLQEKSNLALRLSRLAVADGGWNGFDQATQSNNPQAWLKFQKKMRALDTKFFGPNTNNGSVYLVVVKNGEAFETFPDDPIPMQDLGPATPWELAAYRTGTSTRIETPYSDRSGTYLGAFTPLSIDRKVAGLVAVEFDTAPIDDFRSIISEAFGLALIPAVCIALVVALILTRTFIEPAEFVRKINAVATHQSINQSPNEAKFDPIELLAKLTPRERDVALMAGQQLSRKEIGDKLRISDDTVKQHLKRIKEKTGLNKNGLLLFFLQMQLKPIEGFDFQAS
jgi:DNA-binding CsgD family transcriptional regulator